MAKHITIAIYAKQEELEEAEEWVDEYCKDEYEQEGKTVEYWSCDDLSIDSLRRDFKFGEDRPFFLIKGPWYFHCVYESYDRRVAVNHVFRADRLFHSDRPNGSFESLESVAIAFVDAPPCKISLNVVGKIDECIRRKISMFDVMIVPTTEAFRRRFFEICGDTALVYSLLVITEETVCCYIPGKTEFESHGIEVDEGYMVNSHYYFYDPRRLFDFKDEDMEYIFHIWSEHGVTGDEEEHAGPNLDELDEDFPMKLVAELLR
ncbi:hypothetical protein GGI12_004460 [Dipsacomyces acuminosporus]|nr:hypothetical protein GGI12_004460 [Dipsacomyces acuminosporus]